jgi:hypothetical protein
MLPSPDSLASMPMTSPPQSPLPDRTAALTLIETAHHRVSAYLPDVPSDTLIITFCRQRRGCSEPGFGDGFVKWLGFSHVFVSDGAETLYQHLDPEDLLRATAGLRASHDRVFLYGSELGGPAALFHANWFKARAVAISPRMPAHPYYQPWLTAGTRSLTRLRRLQPDLPKVADPTLSPVLLYDPWYGPDAAYVETLVRPSYPEALFVPIRGAGARVARILAYQRRLRPILADIFLHDRSPQVDYAPDRRPRGDLRQALRALARGEAEEASRYLFRVMRDPSTPGLPEAMARYRDLTGRQLLM